MEKGGDPKFTALLVVRAFLIAELFQPVTRLKPCLVNHLAFLCK